MSQQANEQIKNEPFIILKNYRSTHSNLISKSSKKTHQNTKQQSTAKQGKSKNVSKKQSKPPEQQQQIPQEQQSRIFNQFLQLTLNSQPNQQFFTPQLNQISHQEEDEFSPIHRFGVPLTPQNFGRRASKDDDDFKL